ncbi:hypothetical protein MICPUN_64999 [Micromonas commoda]|uniref:Ndc10 domain-containing protein n=1 Tax=Micromonas commoda (strain RCC299 / NOUM17 / CCMP2709) TaxID=296587 RepID=C1EJN3_MICCC|nr:hypothetical protein MICPUN_64999 [Micromonas commoda]ACO68259.1 hypothetical protein MICPUN_64999 [Micromonas commoda]|eukprot:XP_002507001.1 hypothetical protein MICPUN_64999 [Micromonas commoda]
MALVTATADDLALALRDDSGALAHPGNAGIVATTGNSRSWSVQQNNVSRIFNMFAAYLPYRVDKDGGQIPNPFPNLGSLMGMSHKLIIKEHATSQQMWQLFGEYLVRDYRKVAGKGAGEHLGINTVSKIFATAMQLAYKVHAGDPFFLCLDHRQDINLCLPRRWFVVVRENMWREIFTRAVQNGEKMDESATPLTFDHLTAIMKSYSRMASTNVSTGRAAHRRKFIVLSLFQVAGRSGEIATLSYKKLEWDPYFRCVHVEVNQVKTVKTKKVVFTAGINRHLCWFTNFGDRLCTESYTDKASDEDDVAWLFPDLVDISSPGSRVGDYIRDLRRQGGAKEYKEFAVDCLPSDINAAGIRAGCCNILHSNMPECFAITVTGHKLESGAHQEYIDATTANAMPGAVVLGGFPALPWGQRGVCGKPADLDSLAHVPLTYDGFDTIIDELYGITNVTEAVLSKGGALRPVLKSAFASQVMHYAARVAAGECNDVNTRLRQALVQTGNATKGHAHVVLEEWGKILVKRFEQDNRHLLLREKAELPKQMAAIMQVVQTKVEGNANEIAALRDTVELQNTLIMSMAQQQQQLMQAFNKLLPLRGNQGNVYAAESNIAEPIAPPDNPALPAAEAEAAPAEAEEAPGPVDPIALIDLTGRESAPRPSAAPPSALSALMVNRPSADLADDRLPNVAYEFLVEAYSKHGGQVWKPPGYPEKTWMSRKLEANLTLTVLTAMLTEDERKLMRRQSTAASRLENTRLAQKAELMTKKFFQEWFEDAKVELPQNLRKRKRDAKGKLAQGASQPMVLSSVANFLRALGVNKDDLRLQPEELKKWAEDSRSDEERYHQWRKQKGPAKEPAAEEPSPPKKKSWGWFGRGGDASGGGASGGGASGGSAAV